MWGNDRIVSLFHHVQTSSGAPASFIEHVLGALTPGLKQLRHETDHSPPCSAEIKNAYSYTSTPPVCLYGMVPN
jgi:hypothetical protein